MKELAIPRSNDTTNGWLVWMENRNTKYMRSRSSYIYTYTQSRLCLELDRRTDFFNGILRGPLCFFFSFLQSWSLFVMNLFLTFIHEPRNRCCIWEITKKPVATLLFWIPRCSPAILLSANVCCRCSFQNTLHLLMSFVLHSVSRIPRTPLQYQSHQPISLGEIHRELENDTNQRQIKKDAERDGESRGSLGPSRSSAITCPSYIQMFESPWTIRGNRKRKNEEGRRHAIDIEDKS